MHLLSFRVVVPACVLSLLSLSGCVHGPRTFHAGIRPVDTTLCSIDQEVLNDVSGTAPLNGQNVALAKRDDVEVVQGQPNQLVDGVGWIIGVPRKVMLWDRRVDNHQVQPETMAEVAAYARAAGVEDLCVRINQYAPLDEWKRLTQNDRVSPGWRYTMGTLSLVGYTLFPGRVLGGDNYNPYTNSVYVYSDIPALAIEAAAYAKDVQQRDLPGTYAAVNQLPLVSVWHETINTQEALDYLQSQGTPNELKQGLAVLYPNYGASVGGAIGTVFGVTAVFEVGGAVVGHVSGWRKVAQLDDVDTVQLDSVTAARRMDTLVRLQ